MEPEDYPMFTVGKRQVSFLDCSCDDNCLGAGCPYCQFLLDGQCPGEDENADTQA